MASCPQGEMRLPLRPLPDPTAVSLSQSCSCLMATMALVLILVPRPSLSLHPSQGVSLGVTVTLRCHLPRMRAWVQLWLNGTLKSDKQKDKEQDTAEFSFAVTNLEDAGTYQCRYQVSEPLWTSERSEPVELVLTGEGTMDTRWPWCLLLPACKPQLPPTQHFPEPREHVAMGTDVTTHRWNGGHGGTFLLHTAECSDPILNQDPTGNTVGGVQKPTPTQGGLWPLPAPVQNPTTPRITHLCPHP
uniref:Ig-like domain-containing protein n=1 Tax=Phasianus colchicus TaxID=9054 RepID=A0A669QGR0_PHACC